MEMSRRTFLKVLGAAGLAAGAPALSLVPVEVESQRLEQIWLVREIVQYAIERDTYLVRHDILTDDGQWHVDQGISSGRGEIVQAELENARKVALMLLGNQLTHMGKSWRDLKYLPLPVGINHAKYVPARELRNALG